MTLDEYHELAMRTASPKDQLLHAALGAAGEAGELVDAVKRHLIYGQPLDPHHTAEELGDLMWYVSLGCKAIGVTMEQVASWNIEKLKVRYPERFTEEHAALRLDKENEQ